MTIAPNVIPTVTTRALSARQSSGTSTLVSSARPIGLTFFYAPWPAAAASSGILISSFVIVLWRLAPTFGRAVSNA